MKEIRLEEMVVLANKRQPISRGVQTCVWGFSIYLRLEKESVDDTKIGIVLGVRFFILRAPFRVKKGGMLS